MLQAALVPHRLTFVRWSSTTSRRGYEDRARKKWTTVSRQRTNRLAWGPGEHGRDEDVIVKACPKVGPRDAPLASIDIGLDRHQSIRSPNVDRRQDVHWPRLAMNGERTSERDRAGAGDRGTVDSELDRRIRRDLKEIAPAEVLVALLLLVSIELASRMIVPLTEPSSPTVPDPPIALKEALTGMIHKAFVLKVTLVRSGSKLQLPTSPEIPTAPGFSSPM